jgi:hypothetical protein
MAFQQVAGSRRYMKPSEMTPGQFLLEGWYMGPIPSSFGGEDHLFRCEDGSEVVLNKSGHLAHCLKQVTPKALCQVHYVGTVKLPPGHKYAKMNKDVHNFKVLTDPDNVYRGTEVVQATPIAKDPEPTYEPVIEDEVGDDL